jgi:integrase
MKEAITTELIRNLPPGPCDIWDTKLAKFVVRVRPTGKASYLVSRGRGCWHTIAAVDELAPHKARELARTLLGEDATDRTHGRDPVAERKKRHATQSSMTFEAFLNDRFEPWAREHYKRGPETVQRLRTVFAEVFPVKLAAIDAWTVEKWRTQRLKDTAVKPATINSHVTMLKAALAKAVAWKLLTVHPLTAVKALKADKAGRIRYLAPAEEQRLRRALCARDEARQQRREQANAWRRARGYAEWPAQNPDHLTPIVLLALNTGLRKGEIFNLAWTDIDWTLAQLTVRGESDDKREGSKTRQSRHVPLNHEALELLKAWRAAIGSPDDGYVFPGDDRERLNDVKKAWMPVVKAAKLSNFTFHDLRHTFASKLVMAGIDLNTVRELLGHSDIKMTLRYAHLASAHKAAAVAKLVGA